MMEVDEGGGFADDLLELCRNFPEGVTNMELDQRFPNVSKGDQAAAVNQLLKEGKLELQKMGNGMLIYKYKQEQNPELKQRLKGASTEEMTIYDVVQEAGNRGIWLRDIREKCGEIKIQQLNKLLKNLEHKKLIKSVKSAEAKRKKMYMLYDLEPDQTITGGIFYSDGSFDPEVIRVLTERCLKELTSRRDQALKQHPLDLEQQKEASYVPSTSIWHKIKESGVFKEDLTVSNVEQILETLVLDGKAERGKGGNAFRAKGGPPLPTFGLTSIPCTYCPLYQDCTPGGAVSPTSCTFLKEWNI